MAGFMSIQQRADHSPGAALSARHQPLTRPSGVAGRAEGAGAVSSDTRRSASSRPAVGGEAGYAPSRRYSGRYQPAAGDPQSGAVRLRRRLAGAVTDRRSPATPDLLRAWTSGDTAHECGNYQRQPAQTLARQPRSACRIMARPSMHSPVTRYLPLTAWRSTRRAVEGPVGDVRPLSTRRSHGRSSVKRVSAASALRGEVFRRQAATPSPWAGLRASAGLDPSHPAGAA